MKPMLILLAIILSSVPQSSDQPYELKGESPGMTLKQFKAEHRRAECVARTAHRTDCRVYEGVSFAGITAMTYKGCTLLECSAQGIFANFVDDRLFYLMYGVTPGSSRLIIETLKKKFGEPNDSSEQSTTCKNSIGYLNVSEAVVPGSDGSVKHIATSVVSALNDKGEGKDI